MVQSRILCKFCSLCKAINYAAENQRVDEKVKGFGLFNKGSMASNFSQNSHYFPSPPLEESSRDENLP